MIVFSIAVPADLPASLLDWLRRMFLYMCSGLENEGGIKAFWKEDPDPTCGEDDDPPDNEERDPFFYEED